MLNAKEMVQKKNMLIEYEDDFSLDVFFSLAKGKERWHIRCLVMYDVEEKKWNYSFTLKGNIDTSHFSENDIREEIEELTKQKREDREKKAEEILSSLNLTQHYQIQKTEGYDQLRVQLEGATVSGKKVDITWFLFDKKTLHLYFLEEETDGEEFEELHFGFSWEFAKKHLKGMKEFEEFLFTKSKDRLTFLF